ncbi:MAG: sigma-70 family RNA polymerase sigma factor [Clostridia bacterium]|nr:sigma-70 family RNA polymerase sigma factor [Clostridia bacterium]
MFELILSVLAGFSAVLLSSAGGNKFPKPLPQEEEAALFRKARLEGDMKARERLIEHNLRLVAHIVRKYYSSHPAEEDLVSIGTIGLIKSVDSFNIDNGARFATYAAKCIQNAILSRRQQHLLLGDALGGTFWEKFPQTPSKTFNLGLNGYGLCRVREKSKYSCPGHFMKKSCNVRGKYGIIGYYKRTSLSLSPLRRFL